MSKAKPKNVDQGAIESALELYYQRRIDLEGLCQLMANAGSLLRAGHGLPPMSALAEELSLLVHERQTVASLDLPVPSEQDGSATVRLETRHAPATKEELETRMDTGAVGPSEVKEEHTVLVKAQATPPPVPEVAKKPRLSIDWDTQKLSLDQFCERRSINSKLHLELGDDAPGLQDPGDFHYAMGRKLGVGGVGLVQLAVDRSLRRSVAIKRLKPASLSDNIQLQAFLEEAMISGGLEHPNIVPVHELSYSPKLGPYYTMKRLNGEALSKLLRRIKKGEEAAVERWSLTRLLGVFTNICKAIAYAHSRQVIHCDLKPANVIVGEFGETVVVDWGLARLLGERDFVQARTLLNSGTPSYMPPEQASGNVGDLDEQADVWSLGAILYELLTLKVVFSGETTEETLVMLMADPVIPPSKRTPERDVPMELERICVQALEKDKLLRYSSVQELLHDLESYLEGRQEELRKEALARESFAEATERLAQQRRAETDVDQLQQQLLNTEVGSRAFFETERKLAEARDELVFGYGDVSAAAARGLDVRPHHSSLRTILGDLYWRTFSRLYPAKIPANEAVRNQAMSLLGEFAKRAFAEIVEHGRQFGQAHGHDVPEQGDDPWLDAVLAFCGPELAVDDMNVPNAMVPVIERIAFLKGVPLFADLSGADLLPIAEVCHHQSYPPRSIIFRQGDPGDALYVVVAGKVDIVRDRSLLTVVEASDCFGEIAVLDHAPRTASALCNGEVTCLVLTAERFREIVRSKGDIGLSVISVLTERLRQATERESSLRRSLD